MDRTRLCRTVQALFERFEIVTPMVTRTALPADFEALSGQVVVDGKGNGPSREGKSPYCYPFNLTGHPALAVSSGLGADAIPTSAQLVGPCYSDLDLLALAGAVEEEQPRADRRPPNH